MKRFLLAAAVILAAIAANADNYRDMEPLKLDVPEMKAELAAPAELSLQEDTYTEVSSVVTSDMMTSNAWKPDFDFFKSKTNPGVKPYKFMDDMTFVGIPLFIAGWAIKSEKNNFKQDSKTKASLLTDFKTGIDDYTQFFGPVMTVGLKLGGYEGRSDWPRLLTSAALSYGLMAGFVNGIKYTAKEMRPDGSTANSWPSGHTATSFVGATILHKEYGLTRSPWFSVAGYGVATATGIMRVLNNRHWISDVMSGAGIGILSGELGYALSDLLFKGKGLLRNDLEMIGDNPSFFSISMGLGWGLNELSFKTDDYEYAEDANNNDQSVSIEFHTASVVDVEGAYFFNKYVGVGGRLRVRAMTAKGWSDFVDEAYKDAEYVQGIVAMRRWLDLNPTLEEPFIDVPANEINTLSEVVGKQEVTIVSDHLTEFFASVGMYFNLPLSKRFSLGSKLLIGRSMMQELDINSTITGKQALINYTMQIDNDEVIEKNTKITSIDQGEPYSVSWDYLTLTGNNSTTFGTGLSLTYRYKSNFSWKIFIDYDYSKKEYTLTYDPSHFMKTAMPKTDKFLHGYDFDTDPVRFKKERNNHFFTVGGSFAITF